MCIFILDLLQKSSCNWDRSMIHYKHFSVLQSNLCSEWMGLPSFLTHLCSQTSTHWFLCQLWLDNVFKSCQQVCTETVGLHQALFVQRMKPKYHWTIATRWTPEEPPGCKETPSSTVTPKPDTPEFTTRIPSNIKANQVPVLLVLNHKHSAFLVAVPFSWKLDVA